MENHGKLFQKIIENHNLYLQSLHDAIAALGRNDHVKDHDRIDRIAFHVIEEIIEMRRTYPHKFWKQGDEQINKEALLEEAADIFLMSRSMYLEVCEVCNITEEDFLKIIFNKLQKNIRRVKNGY